MNNNYKMNKLKPRLAVQSKFLTLIFTIITALSYD
jgi:hypothetical protein